MNLPLYKNHTPCSLNNGNAGLWFDRFFGVYTDNFKEIDKKESENTRSALKQWCDQLIGHTITEDPLKKYTQRQKEMITSLNGTSAVFKTTWHFVTGMGNPHPMENGFTFHHTLGVPYLPGSAVKGLIRSWIEEWVYADKSDPTRKEKLMQWFGSDHKGPKLRKEKARAGDLIFFDAIPTTPPKLTVDIMTPHMGKWYEAGADITNINEQPEAVPADWHDPVPVPYLAADTVSFLFGIAPRPKTTDIDMKDVINALENALKWLGAGAKTAVGYGQMEKDESTTKAIEQVEQQKQDELEQQKALEEKTQGLSPLAKEFAKQCEQEDWCGNKDNFWKIEVIEEWLEKLEHETDQYILDTICDLMKKHFKGIMDNPDKTKGKQGKFVYKENQRKIAGRLISLLKK